MAVDAKKPLLVLINPYSGTKLASKLFRTVVKPELDQRRLLYEVLETEYAGQAEEVARSTDNLNEKYSGFIIISGDGLVHEVVNGLAQRPDWNEISKIPFGIIPGGSGNALNCSILHQLGQPLDGLNNLGSTWSALNSAIGAEQNNFLPFDLMEIELHNGQKSISFLGITIGLVADVDLGSEVLRCLGYIRAYFLVALRMIFPKPYYAKVSYLPLKTSSSGKPIPVSEKEPRLNLPNLNSPLPQDWITEEGHYYIVYASNLSMLDPLTLFCPDSRIDDGIMNLVLVENTFTRFEMLQWLMSTREAGHVGKTGVKIIPVRAFRIEPVRPMGYMSLDAESVPFGSSQGQILPGKGRIYVSDQRP